MNNIKVQVEIVESRTAAAQSNCREIPNELAVSLKRAGGFVLYTLIKMFVF